MSAKLYHWFEEKAKRLNLRDTTELHNTFIGLSIEQMRQVEVLVKANNRWFELQRQMHQQHND